MFLRLSVLISTCLLWSFLAICVLSQSSKGVQNSVPLLLDDFSIIKMDNFNTTFQRIGHTQVTDSSVVLTSEKSQHGSIVSLKPMGLNDYDNLVIEVGLQVTTATKWPSATGGMGIWFANESTLEPSGLGISKKIVGYGVIIDQWNPKDLTGKDFKVDLVKNDGSKTITDLWYSSEASLGQCIVASSVFRGTPKLLTITRTTNASHLFLKAILTEEANSSKVFCNMEALTKNDLPVTGRYFLGAGAYTVESYDTNAILSFKVSTTKGGVKVEPTVVDFLGGDLLTISGELVVASVSSTKIYCTFTDPLKKVTTVKGYFPADSGNDLKTNAYCRTPLFYEIGTVKLNVTVEEKGQTTKIYLTTLSAQDMRPDERVQVIFVSEGQEFNDVIVGCEIYWNNSLPKIVNAKTVDIVLFALNATSPDFWFPFAILGENRPNSGYASVTPLEIGIENEMLVIVMIFDHNEFHGVLNSLFASASAISDEVSINLFIEALKSNVIPLPDKLISGNVGLCSSLQMIGQKCKEEVAILDVPPYSKQVCDSVAKDLSKNCDSYQPSSGWGDPHFTTFDGGMFDFMGGGEFWLLRPSENYSTSIPSIQGRMKRSGSVSWFTAFAVKVHHSKTVSTIQVEIGYSLNVLIDGVPISTSNSRSRITKYLPGCRIHFSKSRSSIVIWTPHVAVSMATGSSFVPQVDPALRGRDAFWSMFGNFNGKSSDDIIGPDGSVYSGSWRGAPLHDFLMQWQVLKNDSYFIYQPPTSYETYNPSDGRNFVANPRLDSLTYETASTEAKALCGTSMTCIYDYEATNGNASLAMMTLNSEIAFQQLVEAAKNETPKCSPIDYPTNGVLLAPDGFVVQASVTLVCRPGYGPADVQHATVTCLEDRVWSAALTSCKNTASTIPAEEFSSNTNAIIIAIAIVCSVVVFAVIVILLVYCCFCKKNSETKPYREEGVPEMEPLPVKDQVNA